MLPVPVRVMPVGVVPAAPPIVTSLAVTAPLTLSALVSDRLNALPVTAKPSSVPIAFAVPFRSAAAPLIPPLLCSVAAVSVAPPTSLIPPVLVRSTVAPLWPSAEPLFSAIPLAPATSVTVGAAMLPLPVSVMPVGVVPAAPPIVTPLAVTAPLTLRAPVSDRLSTLPVTAKPSSVPIAFAVPFRSAAPPLIPPLLCSVAAVSVAPATSLMPPVLVRSTVAPLWPSDAPVFSAIPLAPATSVTSGAAMLPVPVSVMPLGVVPAVPPIVTPLAVTAPLTLKAPLSDRLIT